MARPDFTASQLGLTPRKIALVVVLALVLATVLFVQFRSPQPATDTANSDNNAAGRALKPHRLRPSRPQATVPSKTVARVTRAWPEMTREEAQQHNPFRIPDRLAPTPQPAVDQQATAADEEDPHPVDMQRQRQEFLDSLRESGVTLVVESGGEKVAYIGSLSVRVGQEVNGLRVTDIGRDGVIFEETDGK